MRHARAIGVCCLLVTALAGVATAVAADDPLAAAYQRFHQGDRGAARREFEALVTLNPSGLPARLGLLQVLNELSREDTSLEAEFERRMDGLIADAGARHDRSETDDEAAFTLANAYLLRAEFRVNHGKGMFSAARDAAKSKRLIDAYVKRHPEHGDAYFALGTYNYYVEIAPSLVKLIRPLLFLPSGNRTEGLKQLERAYTQGNLFAFDAGMILMDVYGSFEGRPADGLRIGERLASQFPDNPQVRFQLADMYLGPAVEDPVRASAQYQMAIASESRRQVPRQALYRAQLGLSTALAEQWRLDEAVRLLTVTIDAKPSSPAWVVPLFLLRRANYRALTGDPRAEDDTRHVLGEPNWKDQQKAAENQLKWLRTRNASGEGAVYTALVPGNRLAADHRWDEAAASYDAVRRQHPRDPQVRYRIALLQFNRGNAAAAALEAASLVDDKNAPSWIRAQALLMVARADDLAGRRDQAKREYQRIVDAYEHESASWPAKAGLVSPYRPH